MSPTPVWAHFHQYVHVVPPFVSILAALPSLVCVALVTSRVVASTLATPFSFLPSFVFLVAFVRSSCHIIAS